jgi:hypothetical protein
MLHYIYKVKFYMRMKSLKLQHLVKLVAVDRQIQAAIILEHQITILRIRTIVS